MKKCNKCNVVKQLTDFYCHGQCSSGFFGKCKSCTKDDVKRHRQENIDKVRAYDRDRPNKNERAKQSAEYNKTEKGKEVRFKATKNYREKNPLKYKANTAVGNALRDKRLTRPNQCVQCSEVCKPQGHHDDYTKPLVVRWLCVKCHSAFHNNAREILREDGVVSGYMLIN